MRTIKYTKQYKRDYKREKKSGQHGISLDDNLLSIIELLVKDIPLPQKTHDHSLSSNWKDYRDCHIKPDLMLISITPQNAISSSAFDGDSDIYQSKKLKIQGVFLRSTQSKRCNFWSPTGYHLASRGIMGIEHQMITLWN